MLLNKRKIKYFILVIFLGTTIWTWSVVFGQASDDILKVVFFDVGQGDSIFIETSNDKQILIDGGPDNSILEKLNQTMPFHDRTIDLIILTHPDADHITGLVEVLNYYQIGHILTSGLEKDTAVYTEWKESIEERNISLSLAQMGQRIVLQDEIVLEVLWPNQNLISSYSNPANNASVVTRLVYKDIEFLLTGDIEKKVENYLVNQDFNLESDILKLAHHGGKTSTIYNFLKSVNPKICIISVGENNRYKHPSQEILERVKDLIIYRTDKDGDIQILTDGTLFDIIEL